MPTPDDTPIPPEVTQLELELDLPPDRLDDETVSGGLVVYTPPAVSDEWDDTNTDAYTPARLAPTGAPRPDDDVPVMGRIEAVFAVQADQTVQQAVAPIRKGAAVWLEASQRARLVMAAAELVRLVVREVRSDLPGTITIRRERSGAPIRIAGCVGDETIGERVC